MYQSPDTPSARRIEHEQRLHFHSVPAGNSLAEQLQKAIETENYEEAARLRDQLKELESVASVEEGS